MKSAFSLIELILTIVIMSIIFALIPKIIFAINKSDNFSIKQDAIFNTLSLTKIVSVLAWDENNTQQTKILDTDGSIIFDCNSTTDIRQGSFLGSRSCTATLSASKIAADESSKSSFDDLDDFNGSITDVNTTSGKTKYAIYSNIDYLSDDTTVFSVSGTTMSIDLSKSSISSNSTNIKKLTMTVAYKGSRGKERNITSFSYYSTNIGQLSLNSENW